LDKCKSKSQLMVLSSYPCSIKMVN